MAASRAHPGAANSLTAILDDPMATTSAHAKATFQTPPPTFYTPPSTTYNPSSTAYFPTTYQPQLHLPSPAPVISPTAHQIETLSPNVPASLSVIIGGLVMGSSSGVALLNKKYALLEKIAHFLHPPA